VKLATYELAIDAPAEAVWRLTYFLGLLRDAANSS
jgi:hypothetical protein